jgi:hypothetical protein
MELTHIIRYALPLLFIIIFLVMMLHEDKEAYGHEYPTGVKSRLRCTAASRRASGKQRRDSINEQKVLDLLPKPQDLRRR